MCVRVCTSKWKVCFMLKHDVNMLPGFFYFIYQSDKKRTLRLSAAGREIKLRFTFPIQDQVVIRLFIFLFADNALIVALNNCHYFMN